MTKHVVTTRSAPPARHELAPFWSALREHERKLSGKVRQRASARVVVDLLRVYLPRTRRAIDRHLRQEQARQLLEKHPLFFFVTTEVDVRRHGPILSAMMCVSERQLLADQRRLARGERGRIITHHNMSGAIYLHGCRVQGTRSAHFACTYGSSQRHLISHQIRSVASSPLLIASFTNA
jgi:hypothetical protein